VGELQSASGEGAEQKCENNPMHSRNAVEKIEDFRKFGNGEIFTCAVGQNRGMMRCWRWPVGSLKLRRHAGLVLGIQYGSGLPVQVSISRILDRPVLVRNCALAG
jgi:hypothetical protein